MVDPAYLGAVHEKCGEDELHTIGMRREVSMRATERDRMPLLRTLQQKKPHTIPLYTDMIGKARMEMGKSGLRLLI